MGGGTGGSQTTTVDPVYNAGMLELSQEQQGWAAEMFNMFKYGVPYDPNEKVQQEGEATTQKVRKQVGTRQVPTYPNGPTGEMVMKEEPVYEWVDEEVQGEGEWTTRGELEGYDPDAQVSEMQYLQNLVEANQGLLFGQTELSRLQTEAETELLPFQTGSTKAGLELTRQQAESAARMLGPQEEAELAELSYKKQLMESQGRLLPEEEATRLAELNYQKSLSTSRSELLPEQTALAKKGLKFQSAFLDEAGKGVDSQKWMDQAQAGVQHGYKLARESMKKDVGSYGLDPSSGRYTSTNRGLALGEAAGIAGARTSAQRAAEQEDFERKRTAAGGLNIPSI